MRIKILGSSSKGNCYIVSDGQTTILLDCGVSPSDVLKEVDFDPYNIDGALITHCHKDHSAGAKKLSEKYGVDIYCSAGTADAVNLPLAHTVVALKKFAVGNSLTVMPFDVEHDAPEPLGFCVYSSVTNEKLLYITDTYYCKYKFKGLTHIMLEANYDIEIIKDKLNTGEVEKSFSNRLLSSHMSIEHAEQLLKANDLSKLQKVYLCHLSDRNSNAELFRERIEKAVNGAEVIVC